MSLVGIHFDIDVLAQSSIVHREDYSAVGTDNFALFRREKIITPTGEVMQVPIVSGSSFRGILRRIGDLRPRRDQVVKDQRRLLTFLTVTDAVQQVGQLLDRIKIHNRLQPPHQLPGWLRPVVL